MKKIYFVLAVLLCAVMVWTVPVGAEEMASPTASRSPGDGASLQSKLVPSEARRLPEGEGMEEMPEAAEGVEWDMEEVKAYINETVIPAAVMVVMSLATLYIALVPVFNKVKAVIAKFNRASDEITATAGESELTKKNVKETLDKLSGEYAQLLSQNEGLKASYAALEGKVTAALGEMAEVLSARTAQVCDMSEQIEKMLIVGFCNNKELMDKGYARKIAELGAGIDVSASGEKEEGDEQDKIEGNT